MKKFRNQALRMLAFGLMSASLVLSSCKKDEDPDPTPETFADPTITSTGKEWNQGDTITKKSSHKYALNGEPLKKSKVKGPEDYPPRYEYDSIGRIITKIDTTKFGHNYAHYEYDRRGNLRLIRNFFEMFSREPVLTNIDSIFYNKKKQVTRYAQYTNFDKTTGEPGHTAETINQYDENGLLIERIVFTRYLTLRDSKGNFTKWTYEYQVYH